MPIEQVILSVSLSRHFFPNGRSRSPERAPLHVHVIKMSFFSNTNLLCMFIMSETTCYIVSNAHIVCKCAERNGKR